MERFNVDCQNKQCGVSFELACEENEVWEGSQHTAKCPACNRETYFTSTYIAVVDDASLSLE